MGIQKRFSKKISEGKEIYIFTLRNSKGITAEITNLGGVILSIKVPDKQGNFEDVVLGYERIEDYLEQGPYFGAIIGRFANRINKATFTINEVEYVLTKNDGNNQLHGGAKGFDKVVWDAEVITTKEGEALELSYFSKDGEEGYPGNLKVKVTYTLREDNALKIDYHAISDKDTVVNLTNHTYFNLSSHMGGSILDHKLMINGDSFTATNEEFIATGEIREVKGTPMDFRASKIIGEHINSSYDQIVFGKGYDHNWILKVSGKVPEKAIELKDENSGRVLEVYTTKPGVQFYSGNFLDGSYRGKDGAIYHRRSGLCFETQYFPNSMNIKDFPSPILRAGDEYRHTTIFKFTIED